MPVRPEHTSTKDEKEVRRLVRYANATDAWYTTPVDEDALLQELDDCRRNGFCEGVDTVGPGAASVAMLLPVDFSGMKLAASIACHSTEFDLLRPRLLSLLRETVAHYFPDGVPLPPRPRSSIPQPTYGLAGAVPYVTGAGEGRLRESEGGVE